MGSIRTKDGIRLHYDEYGAGGHVILSAQAGFYPAGMQQALAGMGYHVFCLTLRGFAPSDYVTEDYGEAWYDMFADDVICLADTLGIGQFSYLGASHGAGVGWHLALRCPERVLAFVAVVPGPHSLAEGAMSYRQMLMQGLISAPPPFDPPIDNDPGRENRRRQREEWLAGLPEADPREKQIDYGRPLMRCGTEAKLREALGSIQTPTLILGGTEDPISTPELMTRTARCLPHCKLVMYSGCGHNIDTDLTEELAGEADRFLTQAAENGKWYTFPERGLQAAESSSETEESGGNSAKVIQISDPERKQAIAREILEALPDWFENVEGREQYIRESRERVFFAAERDSRIIGFLCLKETGSCTVELAVMGVRMEYHRQGAGKALFQAARNYAAAAGYAFMQVKTVQMGYYEDYDRTNRFYQSLGFREFEVIPSLWGEENPCQIYILSLK